MCRSATLGRAGPPRTIRCQVTAAGPLRSGMTDFARSQALDERIDPAFPMADAARHVGPGAAIEAGPGDRMVPEMVDHMAGNRKE